MIFTVSSLLNASLYVRETVSFKFTHVLSVVLYSKNIIYIRDIRKYRKLQYRIHGSIYLLIIYKMYMAGKKENNILAAILCIYLCTFIGLVHINCWQFTGRTNNDTELGNPLNL